MSWSPKKEPSKSVSFPRSSSTTQPPPSPTHNPPPRLHTSSSLPVSSANLIEIPPLPSLSSIKKIPKNNYNQHNPFLLLETPPASNPPPPIINRTVSLLGSKEPFTQEISPKLSTSKKVNKRRPTQLQKSFSQLEGLKLPHLPLGDLNNHNMTRSPRSVSAAQPPQPQSVPVRSRSSASPTIEKRSPKLQNKDNKEKDNNGVDGGNSGNYNMKKGRLEERSFSVENIKIQPEMGNIFSIKPKKSMSKPDDLNSKESKQTDQSNDKKKRLKPMLSLSALPSYVPPPPINPDEGKNHIPKEATFEELLEKLTDHDTTPEFMLTFLLIYRTICTPQELLESLIKRSEVNLMRAMIFLNYWVTHYWADFYNAHQTLLPIINKWYKSRENDIEFTQKPNIPERIYNKITKNASSYVPHMSREISLGQTPEYNGGITFWDIQPQEFASQLTLIEENLLKAIKPWEFIGQAWTKSNKEQSAPNIVKFINWFNEVSNWVITLIVTELRLKYRLQIWVRLLEACEHLLTLQNYNGLLEIFSALNSTPVYRLTKTIGRLPKKWFNFYNKYLRLLDGGDRLQWLRSKTANAVGSHIPYLGMYLTDYILIDDGNKDFTPAGLINFRKRKLLAKNLQIILGCQQNNYTELLPQPHIQECLIFTPRCRDSQSLYLFSKYIEPKEGTLFNPELPEELDPDFINKFVGDDKLKAFISKRARNDDKKKWMALSSTSVKLKPPDIASDSDLRTSPLSTTPELLSSLSSNELQSSISRNTISTQIQKINDDYIQSLSEIEKFGVTLKEEIDIACKVLTAQIESNRRTLIEDLMNQQKKIDKQRNYQILSYQQEILQLKRQISDLMSNTPDRIPETND